MSWYAPTSRSMMIKNPVEILGRTRDPYKRSDNKRPRQVRQIELKRPVVLGMSGFRSHLQETSRRAAFNMSTSQSFFEFVQWARSEKTGILTGTFRKMLTDNGYPDAYAGSVSSSIVRSSVPILGHGFGGGSWCSDAVLIQWKSPELVEGGPLVPRIRRTSETVPARSSRCVVSSGGYSVNAK